MTRNAIALVHYPCVDRAGDLYATSITNLDVHDIARAARTYELDAFYVVHPVAAQQDLARAIAGFWEQDKARARNPDRSEALGRVRVVSTVEEAAAAERELGGASRIFTTSAKASPKTCTFADARAYCAEQSGLVVFGTGHGLASSILEWADATIEPIEADASYNHLSVRSAVSIVLDRLFRST